jgi:hypothetical protein
LGKRIGDEQRLETGVYQISAFEFHLKAVPIDNLGGKEA